MRRLPAGTELAGGPCRLLVTGEHVEAATVIATQLGAHSLAPDGAADLTIDVRPLPPGPRRLFGTGQYAAIDAGLVLLRGSGKRPVEVLVPFEELGRHPTLTVAPGSPPIPLLVPIVNVTALAKGVLPLHAAAFDLDGLGVLVTGWSRSGKTETLLAFASHGGSYVGDEWVYLHDDGRMTGLQEPMRVWSWHVRELGERGPRLPLKTRTLFAALDLVAGHQQRAGRAAGGRLRHLLGEQRNVRIPPSSVLPIADSARLDVVILTESHDRNEIVVEEAQPAWVAQRLAPMLPVERAELLTAYQTFRYAFPGRRSDLLTAAEEMERELLTDRLADLPTLVVRHPYPFPFHAMATALRPWLERLRAS